jgi:hypothetical protein
MKFIQVVPHFAEETYNRGKDVDGKVVVHPAKTMVYATEAITAENREAVFTAAASISGTFNADVIIPEEQVVILNRQPSRVHAQLYEVGEEGAATPTKSKNGKKNGK